MYFFSQSLFRVCEAFFTFLSSSSFHFLRFYFCYSLALQLSCTVSTHPILSGAQPASCLGPSRHVGVAPLPGLTTNEEQDGVPEALCSLAQSGEVLMMLLLLCLCCSCYIVLFLVMLLIYIHIDLLSFYCMISHARSLSLPHNFSYLSLRLSLYLPLPHSRPLFLPSPVGHRSLRDDGHCQPHLRPRCSRPFRGRWGLTRLCRGCVASG